MRYEFGQTNTVTIATSRRYVEDCVMIEKLKLLHKNLITINTNIKVNKEKINRNKIENKYSVCR